MYQRDIDSYCLDKGYLPKVVIFILAPQSGVGNFCHKIPVSGTRDPQLKVTLFLQGFKIHITSFSFALISW